MSDVGCVHEMKATDCDYCRPKPFKAHRDLRPASQIVARFMARFDSECDDCGEPMYEGDPICRTAYGDYIHESCTEME
jgi:hypothetical protein